MKLPGNVSEIHVFTLKNLDSSTSGEISFATSIYKVNEKQKPNFTTNWTYNSAFMKTIEERRWCHLKALGLLQAVVISGLGSTFIILR